MKLVKLAVWIGTLSAIKINSEFPCYFQYTKLNMIDEMDAFSRSVDKSRYQNAFDIAEKLNLRLPKVNTTEYFKAGFDVTNRTGNLSKENDTVAPIDPDSPLSLIHLNYETLN